MYEDAKKGKDAARIRAFIEVRPRQLGGQVGLTVTLGQAQAIEWAAPPEQAALTAISLFVNGDVNGDVNSTPAGPQAARHCVGCLLARGAHAGAGRPVRVVHLHALLPHVMACPGLYKPLGMPSPRCCCPMLRCNSAPYARLLSVLQMPCTVSLQVHPGVHHHRKPALRHW